jgi:hypothetical protein
MKQSNIELATLKPLLTGGLVFALVGLLIDMRGTVTQAPSQSQHEVCQGTINAQVTISKEQLAQLLTVPERDNKTKVRDILKEPYCQLPSLQVRAGVAADRDVYPLAFDSEARLVVLYEGDEYAGYRLSF